MKILSASTDTQNAYPIYIGRDLLKNPRLIQKHIRQQQVLIVSNTTVSELYLERIQANLGAYQTNSIIFPDGEQYKDEAHWRSILNTLAEHQHHRDTTLIALGGGVIGDITGFAAACYQRGVRYLQIPTSLLAQVDASIGGKTAINHPAGKNLIGAFHQPAAVIIDITTLHSLPDRELNAGLAEIIKVALIQDADFFNWLELHCVDLKQRDPDTLLQAIERACTIKRDIVSADEKETRDIRALLNFGHTFGHAIEHSLGYGQWLHGEAVSAGMCLAAKVSEHLGWLSHESRQRIEQLLAKLSLPTDLPSKVDCGKLLASMMMDKKIMNQTQRLILLKAIGQGVVTEQVSHDVLHKALQGVSS